MLSLEVLFDSTTHLKDAFQKYKLKGRRDLEGV
jgi:hypothetical protein